MEDEHGRKDTRWKTLEGVATVPEAQKALAKLHDQRDSNHQLILRWTPKLADYTKNYFEYYQQVKDAKRPATLVKEQGALRLWTEHMGGIDYMTIARWVGHKDGGILIGKVYGHLSNEHARRQAQRIKFEPVIVPLPEAATA